MPAKPWPTVVGIGSRENISARPARSFVSLIVFGVAELRLVVDAGHEVDAADAVRAHRAERARHHVGGVVIGSSPCTMTTTSASMCSAASATRSLARSCVSGRHDRPSAEPLDRVCDLAVAGRHVHRVKCVAERPRRLMCSIIGGRGSARAVSPESVRIPFRAGMIATARTGVRSVARRRGRGSSNRFCCRKRWKSACASGPRIAQERRDEARDLECGSSASMPRTNIEVEFAGRAQLDQLEPRAAHELLQALDGEEVQVMRRMDASSIAPTEPGCRSRSR